MVSVLSSAVILSSYQEEMVGKYLAVVRRGVCSVSHLKLRDSPLDWVYINGNMFADIGVFCLCYTKF